LYNRVGDIHYRIGNNDQAINYYEQAADFYAEGGFFNNAIALCNKILRYSPGRTIIYYKLGIISAKKGFNSDAKQNFLEYADRMQRVGKMDEAFRALKEFADLCPGQDDVRLMLADQLARADRKPEALEQLEVLYDTLESEGRTSEAAATIERMKTLDPNFKPTRSATPRPRKKEGLVFLDLDFDTPPMPAESMPLPADDEPGPSANARTQPFIDETASAAPDEPRPGAAPESQRSAPIDGLELTAFGLEGEPSRPVEATPDNVLHFITTPGESRLEDELPEIAPLDIAPLVDGLDEVAGTDSDPRVIQFPVGRIPAPNGSGPLSGLNLISDAGPTIDSSDIDTSGVDDLDESRVAPDDDFVDLGEWLERNRTPASTRMVAHDEEPENNEQKDFAEMLDKFKSGISRNVDEEDFESHYDLGIAFAEMGLMDEAIGSFQKAQRGPDQRLRASEAIGQCFMDKGEAAVAIAVLNKLLHEPGMSDSRLVGVLYLLGRAAESLGHAAEAAGYFHRVLAVQIGFRDAADRLAALTASAK